VNTDGLLALHSFLPPETITVPSVSYCLWKTECPVSWADSSWLCGGYDLCNCPSQSPTDFQSTALMQ
jgi:hypothetical protein